MYSHAHTRTIDPNCSVHYTDVFLSRSFSTSLCLPSLTTACRVVCTMLRNNRGWLRGREVGRGTSRTKRKARLQKNPPSDRHSRCPVRGTCLFSGRPSLIKSYENLNRTNAPFLRFSLSVLSVSLRGEKIVETPSSLQ